MRVRALVCAIASAGLRGIGPVLARMSTGALRHRHPRRLGRALECAMLVVGPVVWAAAVVVLVDSGSRFRPLVGSPCHAGLPRMDRPGHSNSRVFSLAASQGQCTAWPWQIEFRGI